MTGPHPPTSRPDRGFHAFGQPDVFDITAPLPAGTTIL